MKSRNSHGQQEKNCLVKLVGCTLCNAKITASEMKVRLVAAAVTVFLILATSPAKANDGGGEIEPSFEIKGTIGNKEQSGIAYLEVDGVIPIHTGSDDRSVLFVQPGAVLSQQSGNRRLYGASIGTAYRFIASGGITGLNAFYDRNWIRGSGPTRQHARASIGADFQTGRDLIGVNWYIPLSGKATWRDGIVPITEEAIGGAELYYRFALNDHWNFKGRAFFEIDSGGETAGTSSSAKDNRFILTAGASYRIDCKRFGFDIGHDSETDETEFLFSITMQFGTGVARRSCSMKDGGNLIAPVERSKIIVTRRTAIIPFTTLPANVTELFVTIEDGASDANEVWLYWQGGPRKSIGIPDDNPMDEFPGNDQRILVKVHQAQTLNPNLFTDERLTDFERIQAELDVSVEILDRVIRHFKSQNKKVVVFGHSFGAFCLTRYLALKGPGAADRYVIMAGRLDMEKALIDNRLAYLDSNPGGVIGFEYDSNGTKSTKQTDHVPVTRSDIFGQVFQGIMARHRYTKLLSGTDLSKVIFAYGTRDTRTGSLEKVEVDLLKSRGAKVIAVDGGGHDSMFMNQVPQSIVDLIEQ